MDCCSQLLVKTASATEVEAVEEARIVVSTASRPSHGNYDLAVHFHDETSVCSYTNPDGLMNHLHHDSDDHFRRQNLTSSLGDTSHYYFRLEPNFR